MRQKPLISVIMNVYNVDLKYFKPAVFSILNQTYRNLELIVINDGDSENHQRYSKFLNSLEDKRIRYVNNKTNNGIPYCINQGIDLSKGEYVAKMDADDISVSDRLESELEFFKKNPNANVLGTYYVMFGQEHTLGVDYNNYSQKHRNVLLFYRNSGLLQASFLIKKNFLDKYNIRYHTDLKLGAEDYRLWVDCSKYDRLYCLNKVKYLYRRHTNQTSTAGLKKQNYYRDCVRIELVKKLVTSITKDEQNLHLHLCNRELDVNDIPFIYKWTKRLIEANNNKQIYDIRLFKNSLNAEVFVALLKNHNKLGRHKFNKEITKYLNFGSVSYYLKDKTIFLFGCLKKKFSFFWINKEIDNTINQQEFYY